MLELNPAERRELRARAHHLSPVVTIATNGLTPSVVAEIHRSLQAHELIKVRVQGTERDQREELMEQLCNELDAAPVQHIGNILIVWRKRIEEEKNASAESKAKTTARPGTAKSAAAFAAAARRTALIRASAEKRKSGPRAFGSKPKAKR
jgi:RNA-binding protein